MRQTDVSKLGVKANILRQERPHSDALRVIEIDTMRIRESVEVFTITDGVCAEHIEVDLQLNLSLNPSTTVRNASVPAGIHTRG